jgi:hypothetical protein
MMLQNAAAVQQQGVVRIISLADQLMEMPLQSMMPSPEWHWYQSPEAWGNMETPQKMMGMADMQFMQMETPAEKPMMPGHNMCQADNSQLKVPESYIMPPEAVCTQMEPIAMESYLLPHRLFHSPEKASSEQVETPQLRENQIEVELRRCRSEERPRARDNGEALESPRSRVLDLDSIGPLMSPIVRCLASPTPTTPKRQCYVPETPSPDRMHCSWLQQAPPNPYAQPMPTAGLPWHYGTHAMGGLVPHEQVMPEFLQMNGMPCLAPHEGQMFGDMVVQQ